MAIQAIRRVLNMDPQQPVTLPARWPMFSHQARIAAYERNRLIWDGAHEFALDEQDIAERYGIYVPVNIGRIIVTIPADFLFGEDFELDFPQGTPNTVEEQAHEILKRNKARTMFYESKLDAGIEGDCVILVELGEDGLASMRPQPVCDWYPETNPDNIRDVLAHWIGWKRRAMVNNREREFLRLIKHEKGIIRNFVVPINPDGTLGPDSPEGWDALYPDPATRPQAVIETGLDDFALEHIPNWRTAKEFFGRSEFKDIDAMFASLDAVMTQSDQVIGKHTDPILALPFVIFNTLRNAAIAAGDPAGRISKADLDVIALGENGEKPEYITWQGNTEGNLAHADKLVNLIALVSETAPQLLNQGEWGTDLSGRALKILLVRTLAKVNRMRLYYSEAIPNLVVKALTLEGVDNAATYRPTVKWPDGLPQDITEAIDVAVKKLDAGLETRVGAIMSVDDVDEDAARQKADEIEQETQESKQADTEKLVNTFLKAKRGVAPQVEMDARK